MLAGPSLDSWALDMSFGMLKLQFNEAVRLTSLDPLQIVLQNSAHIDEADFSMPLTGKYRSKALNASMITITLARRDYFTLLRASAIAITIQNTFISMSNATIRSTTNTSNEAISSTQALRVSSIQNDTLQPFVFSFSIDMNGQMLVLNFSEPIQKQSFKLHCEYALPPSF